MPLTIGDTSNNYQTYRKEHQDCGRTKSVQINPCKSANETFTRHINNSVGDPFSEPGCFNKSLRNTSPILKAASVTHGTSFKTQGNRTVRKAEYAYNDSVVEPKGSYALRPFADRPSGFYNRKTAEPFTNQNGIGYSEDPHERKDDIGREEYARLNSLILHKNQPFSHVVRQHGTFIPNIMTFGTTKSFPDKIKDPRFVPNYGPWKRGDLLHSGHNKTIGGHNGRSTEYDYVEEQEQDNVRYQKDVRNPIWRTSHQMGKSMGQTTTTLNPDKIF